MQLKRHMQHLVPVLTPYVISFNNNTIYSYIVNICVDGCIYVGYEDVWWTEFLLTRQIEEFRRNLGQIRHGPQGWIAVSVLIYVFLHHWLLNGAAVFVMVGRGLSPADFTSYILFCNGCNEQEHILYGMCQQPNCGHRAIYEEVCIVSHTPHCLYFPSFIKPRVVLNFNNPLIPRLKHILIRTLLTSGGVHLNQLRFFSNWSTALLMSHNKR